MGKSLNAVMKTDRKIFRKYSRNKDEAGIVLAEHYPMIERCVFRSESECRRAERKFKDPELLPGLFYKCTELCSDGFLPDSEEISDYFNGELSGICIEYLPLVITCALLHGCALSVLENDPEKLKKYILSLQKMRDTDFDHISEKLFSAEKILMDDPAGIYSCVDNETKARYRRKIASAAIKNGKSEFETAADILLKAKESGNHIGECLFTTVKNRKHGMVCLALKILIPALVCLAAGILSSEWIISILLFVPLCEILQYPADRAISKRFRPRKLLSLDPNCKKVSDVHALIVLSVVLPAADKISEIKDKLEAVYLSNASENIAICCLGDFKAADMPRKPEDKHILNALNNTVEELNEKYGGGFVAAVRPRSYSETQNEFIGKERKRGAIRELVRAIKGNDKGFLSIKGDTACLNDTKYLIVLDYDSRPVFDSVRELIAVAEHPVNKPVIKNGRVVSGYGILAPKMQISLSSAQTFFGSVMSGNTGISSYDEQSSEYYQTLFGESIFCGKGLINVDVYYELLDNGLPKEKVLSHDIVEGEYLRTGFVSGVQIIEDFPDSSDSYFKRLHRWVRGDWQNSGFIFSKNPLGFVSRYKLFDNLRRSITPAVCLGVTVYSAFNHSYAGIAAAIIAAFALCSSDIFAGINSVIHFGHGSVTGLYYSKKLPEALGCFVRAVFSVVFSARESFVSLDATVKALWRLLISGDNLLEWTPSATHESKKTTDLPLSCLPAIFVSGILIAFGLPFHRLLGLIILGDIPLTFFANSNIHRKKTDISASQRDYLMSNASAIWGYFEDLCTEENNFLPPDNIQFAPHRALAKRTSPTNIGLMFACFLAARDFGFISSEELYNRLNSSLKSIEKLEKYKGNLLNWYDISTLETLTPRFVSAVDSGNFLCCLTAVKEGISEYENECGKLKTVANKIEKIISSTDLGVMYNSQRKLFHIGINPDNGEKTESCYDLYMSEIRMTAFLAVARKFVPKNHWGSLDRPFIKRGRYTGLSSWTGTMFEYFMADIFVPAPEGSLSNEALKFCLQSQRKKVGKNPFGISESAFYSFDSDLNYQYKAHGVQTLGLKRGLDKEDVISPYSSFLTLNIAPQLSLNNLKKLEKLGMTGKYGFYEAVDFTKGRNNGSYSVVNSFMVHHLAMSFLSIDNLLNEKCMQRRFMTDRYTKGAETLLEEKIVQTKEVFRDVVSDTVIPRLRERVSANKSEWMFPDSKTPKINLFSNGRATLCVTDSGKIKLIFDGEEQKINSNGIIGINGKNIDLYGEGLKVRHNDSSVMFKSEIGDLRIIEEVCLLKNSNSIIKKYNIENKSEKIRINLHEMITAHLETGLYFKGGFTDGNSEKDIVISTGEKKEFVFAFSFDTSEDDVINATELMKSRKTAIKKASNPFCTDEYLKALSEKYLHDIMNKKRDFNVPEVFGIKADYPIILSEVNGNDSLESVRQLVVFNKILRNCGINNTLIICCNVSEDEKNALLQTIEAFMHEEGCDLMLGIGGGVLVFNEKIYKKSDIDNLKRLSAAVIC